MLLLQARSPRSARDLSRTLEVSMRTIYRDVDALSMAGVPVYAERGSNGGIALSDGYRKAIAQFSTDELHALFVAAADPLADLGVTGHERALHKLEGALPDLQQRAAQKARERILLDHRKWYRSEQPSAILAVLRRAVWDDRVVRLTYRDRGGAVTQRDAEPYGLVSKAGVWYVVARDCSNGEMRSFRAERMVSVEETAQHFERPPEFHLDRYWDESTKALQQSGDGFEATFLVQIDSADVLEPFFTCETLAQDESTKTLRVRFPSERVAMSHAMMLGSRGHVVAPDALREAVRNEAEAVAQALR